MSGAATVPDDFHPENGGRAMSPPLAAIPGGGETEAEIQRYGEEIARTVEAERQNHAPEVFPPATPEQTRVQNWLREKPPEPEALLTCRGVPWLLHGIVGMANGTGGTGKSFFLLGMAYQAAKGGNFGPIRATRPLNVLVVFAEDPQKIVGTRAWAISKGQGFPVGLHALSVLGKVGPLMELSNNNPVRAKGFDWLDQTLANFTSDGGLDLVIIDPLSRFYGLDENNNAHATAFISTLEALAVKHRVTILFSHHTSKTRAGDQTHHASRGASAFSDGCRWVIAMCSMSEEVGKRHRVDPSQYVDVAAGAKANYTPGQSARMYFRRTEGGVLVYEALEADRRKAMARVLLSWIAGQEQGFSRNDLTKDEKAREIADRLGEEFSGFSRRKDMPTLVDYVLSERWAIEEGVKVRKATKKIIRVQSLPDDEADLFDLNRGA